MLLIVIFIFFNLGGIVVKEMYIHLYVLYIIYNLN